MLRPSRARPVEPSGFDTAARADLALAIAARGAHAQASAVLDGAWGSLNATLAAARGELEAAQAELAVAQGKAAEDAVSAALGGIPSPAGDVPAARAKLQAAQDALSVAGVAFDSLPERQARAASQAGELATRVDRAAARVLAEHPFVASLAERTEAMQRQVVVMMTTLAALRSSGVVKVEAHTSAGPFVSDHDRRINRVIDRLTMQGRFWIDGSEDNADNLARFGASRWQHALEDLKVNPQAPLPIVEVP